MPLFLREEIFLFVLSHYFLNLNSKVARASIFFFETLGSISELLQEPPALFLQRKSATVKPPNSGHLK